MPGALDDVRVLDFTHALNGPFCTMLLGHLGAEVIKIEPPGGDGFRRGWMPPNAPVDAWEFMNVNTNKKSVAINLKTSAGQDLARRLIAVSDVLVENYQKGVMDSFGLDYERLHPPAQPASHLLLHAGLRRLWSLCRVRLDRYHQQWHDWLDPHRLAVCQE